jgi:hypothetical protein
MYIWEELTCLCLRVSLVTKLTHRIVGWGGPGEVGIFCDCAWRWLGHFWNMCCGSCGPFSCPGPSTLSSSGLCRPYRNIANVGCTRTSELPASALLARYCICLYWKTKYVCGCRAAFLLMRRDQLLESSHFVSSVPAAHVRCKVGTHM